MVLSLQRATSDRMGTSTRYNLGGTMCFGVRDKRDAALALSEYTIKSGAEPHHFQDRLPGRLYLEATGIDPRMFAHQIQTDWINVRTLESVVDAGAIHRTALDDITASALGSDYQAYRELVDAGRIGWQRLRENRYSPGEEQPTVETPVVEGEVSDSGTPKAKKPNPTPEEKREATLQLWSVIMNFAENGQTAFTPKDVYPKATHRSQTWIRDRLAEWVSEGRLYKDERGIYQIRTP